MEKELIADGIEVVTFAPDAGDFATCITVLHNKNEICLIDSGYERHAKAITEDQQGRVSSVVLSHDHEDHSHGCRELPDAQIIAFEGFPEEIFGDRNIEEIADDSSIQFGLHNLNFFWSPGHSRHHLITMIGDDIVQTGDLLINTADKKPTPPYLGDGKSLNDHILSLELLLELDPEILIPGHGPVLKGRQTIEQSIALRLYYLETLRAAGGAIQLAECFPIDCSLVSRHDFHDMNLEKLGLCEA